MKVAQSIRAKLETAFQPQHLVVEDESHRHAGHAGARPEGETHFRVTMVSPSFAGVGRVDRSRRVHEVLADELKGPVHALALSLKAPGEGVQRAAARQVLEGPTVTPESGIRWTPEEPGRAVVIEITEPDLLFAGLLLYARDGSPTWFVAEAKGSGATRTGALPAFNDGQTLDGTWRPNAFAGSPGVASLTFESATAGWPGYGPFPNDRCVSGRYRTPATRPW